MMIKTASGLVAYVLVISEQNRNIGRRMAINHWTASTDNTCAAATMYCESEASVSDKGFAWIRIKIKLLYSYYWSPNSPFTKFQEFLYDFKISIRKNGSYIRRRRCTKRIYCKPKYNWMQHRKSPNSNTCIHRWYLRIYSRFDVRIEWVREVT